MLQAVIAMQLRMTPKLAITTDTVKELMNQTLINRGLSFFDDESIDVQMEPMKELAEAYSYELFPEFFKKLDEETTHRYHALVETHKPIKGGKKAAATDTPTDPALATEAIRQAADQGDEGGADQEGGKGSKRRGRPRKEG